MNERWLIWSLEHRQWWRPNSHGYTPNRDEAGRYGFEEAKQIVVDANASIKPNKPPHEAMIPEQQPRTQETQ